MRLFNATILVALLACPLAAQVRGPSEVSVAVGRLASVPLTVDGDEATYMILGGDVDGFREYDPDPKRLQLRVIGYQPGVAHVVVASQKGGKLQPLAVVKITITGPAPVPPGPGPIPPSPIPPAPPADTLATAIGAAAAKDGWPVAKLVDLATRFRAAARVVDGRQTVGDMLGVVAVALAGEKTPPNVKAILSTELRALDALLPPADVERTVTDAERSQVKALFIRLATACEGAR